MTVPDFPRMRLALLRILSRYPDGISTSDVYPIMTEAFPELAQDDLARLTDDGENYWQNRIRWTRNDLVKADLLDPSQRGVWTLTPEGFAAAQKLTEAEVPNPPLTEDPDPVIVSEPRSRASGDSYSKEAAQKMLIALLHQLSNTDLPWSAETSSDGSVALSYDGRLRVIVRP